MHCNAVDKVDSISVLIRQTVATLLNPNWCDFRFWQALKVTPESSELVGLHCITLAIDYKSSFTLAIAYNNGCHIYLVRCTIYNKLD